VGKIEVKRFFVFDRIGYRLFGFQGERFGEKRLRIVVLFQVRDGVSLAFRLVTVIHLAVIAAWSAERRSGDVDIEAQVEWFGTFVVLGSEVPFAHMDRSVAAITQNPRQRYVFFR
jgi:hypothetical protein